MTRNDKPSLLVTGGCGFIGKSLIWKLQGSFCVTSLDSCPVACSGVPHISCDLSVLDPSVVSRLEEFDAIVHLASQTSAEISMLDHTRDLRDNYLATFRLFSSLSSARKLPKVVYASSMAIYGECVSTSGSEEKDIASPKSIYGLHKLAGESVGRFFLGDNLAILRLFNVYGVGQDLKNDKQGMLSIFLSQILDKNNPIVVKGSSTRVRDFVHVSDVVSAIEASLTSEKANGQTINVGTGVGTTVSNLIALLQLEFGVKFSVKEIESTPGDVQHSVANIWKARNLIGWSPSVSLEAGIAQLADAYGPRS